MPTGVAEMLASKVMNKDSDIEDRKRKKKPRKCLFLG